MYEETDKSCCNTELLIVLVIVRSVKSKSKVDNLYHGSKQSRSLQNCYYNTPLFIGPMPLTATYGHVDMKALARYQIMLLGEQRHIGVNNLPKVVARQCSGRESNPQSAHHESSTLTTTPPSHRVCIAVLFVNVIIL